MMMTHVAVQPEIDTEVELLRQGKPRHAQPLGGRDLLVECIVGGLFLAVAVGMTLGFEGKPDWNTGYAIVLCLLFAVAIRLNFDVGAGYTSPVMLVFVPMLLLLPTPWVPLLVAGSWLLGKLPDHLSGRAHPTKAIFVLGNSWFSVGPALVLILGDAQTLDPGDWPWYLLAIAAQIAGDVVSGFVREWAGRGIAPRLQLHLFSWILLIDVLLWPLGLLAAFSTQVFDYAFLLLLPPATLLIVFANERAGRIDTAMRLYETERGAVRSREALIAGASHEMLTHLSVVMGLSGHIGRLDDARRGEALATMDRELLHLRHMGRQFVDFTRLRGGRTPTVRARSTELRPVLDRVAGAFLTRAELHVDADPALRAKADPDRLEQIVMALVDNAVRYAPGYPIGIRARPVGATVEIDVSDRGPGIDRVTFDALRQGEDVSEGAGIGLFLCRALAEAQGGEIRTAEREGGGSVFTLSLPASG
jgi:signal transduction histidine kinase